MSVSCCSQKMIQGHAYYCALVIALSPSQRAAACARPLLGPRGSNSTNCPLAGRVVVGIRMGVVRPEQGKLQEPLAYFGKRVARLALFRCKCPRCTSSMIKQESSLGCSPWGQAGAIDSLGAKTSLLEVWCRRVKRRAHNLMEYVCRWS